jgi:hypothetical protein
MGRPPQPRKTDLQKWEELSPPDKLLAYVTAGGQALGKVVAGGVFLATGAEVFHLVPDFLDPTRAMDIFAGLSAYFGVPILWSHRPVGRAK